MGTARATLETMVRDIIAEPTAARFSPQQVWDALQHGLNDVAWRLPDDSAMNLRRTVMQVTVAGLAFYPVPSDFMLEKGILSCTLDSVPCGIISDLHQLEGYKQNSLMTPSLEEGPIVYVSEQQVGVPTPVNTWCINTYPGPEKTGGILLYIYRGLPAVLGSSQGSDLPVSCDRPVTLYASMFLKGAGTIPRWTTSRGFTRKP